MEIDNQGNNLSFDSLDDVYAYQSKKSNSDAAKELMTKGKKKRLSPPAGPAMEKRNSVASCSSRNEKDEKGKGEDLSERKSENNSEKGSDEQYTLVKKTKDISIMRSSKTDSFALASESSEKTPRNQESSNASEKNGTSPQENEPRSPLDQNTQKLLGEKVAPTQPSSNQHKRVKSRRNWENDSSEAFLPKEESKHNASFQNNRPKHSEKFEYVPKVSMEPSKPKKFTKEEELELNNKKRSNKKSNARNEEIYVRVSPKKN